MKKIVWVLPLFMLGFIACETKKEQKTEKVVVKKEAVVDTVEVLDSTEIKKRQEEMMKADSIQKAEEEKETKAKQECATKVVFLEKFYEEFFRSPEKTVAQYTSPRFYQVLKDKSSQYEENALPVWIFASGSGANVTYKVNIPENVFSNVFVVDISESGKHYKVYITVEGKDGYYSIDNVKNSLGDY